MRPLAAAVLTIVVAMFTIVVAPLPASAERTQSDFVFIREGETIGEDLYAAGNRIVIKGVVDGDLIASAFTEIRIEGEVRGSVTAIASSVVIDGVVGGSVRAAAGSVEIDGTVGGDVFTASPTVVVGAQASIERDALLWANEVTVLGAIGRNLEGQFRHGTVGADVGGDVDITVSHLTVLSSASIAGDLIYVGDDRASISDDADISGSLIAESDLPPNVRIRALFLLVRFLTSLAVFALGLSLIWSFPSRSLRAAIGVSERPVQAAVWGVGIASIPVALALIVALFVSLSPAATGLPLLLIFAPVVIAAFAVLGVGLLASPVPIASAIGRRIGPARSIYAWFVMGAGVLLAVTAIPVIGAFLAGVAALVGLGGWFVETPEEDPARYQAPSADTLVG